VPAPPQVPAPAGPPAQKTASWPATLESDVPAPGRRGPRAIGALGAASLAGPALAALAVVLVLVGASLRFGSESFWSAIPLWSAFATGSAALGLVAFLAAGANRLAKGPAERLVAGGVAGLAVFWVLVVLADVATDRGFVLTAALACLGGALWIGPRART
jgi:peptidoglycan/LPS O-acetylase OafA/YrhL